MIVMIDSCFFVYRTHQNEWQQGDRSGTKAKKVKKANQCSIRC